MQRRSFFSRIVGAAAVTAVAVEAKPVVVSNHRVETKPTAASNNTVGVTSYGAWKCAHCGNCMTNFHNGTMRCTATDCPNYNKPLRIPVMQTEVVDDCEEVIRHALIIVGVLLPGDTVSKCDLKLCSEVVRRIVKDMNENSTREWPYTAADIRPFDLAYALTPYYKFGTE